MKIFFNKGNLGFLVIKTFRKYKLRKNNLKKK